MRMTLIKKEECLLNSQDLQPTQVGVVDVVLKRDDIREESGSTARFYGI